MSKADDTFELYDGDVLLAVLTNMQWYDFPWLSADFHPTQAYPLYRARLEVEYRASDGDDDEDLEIEPLVLTLIDPQQGKKGSTLLYVEGNWVRFRVSFD